MGRETSAKSAQTLRGKNSNAQARWRGSRNEERIFAPPGALPLRLGYPGRRRSIKPIGREQPRPCSGPCPRPTLLSGHRRGELLGERDTRAASAAAFLRSLKAATSSLGSRSNLPKPCCETISYVMSRVTCSRIARQQGSEPGHRAVLSHSQLPLAALDALRRN